MFMVFCLARQVCIVLGGVASRWRAGARAGSVLTFGYRLGDEPAEEARRIRERWHPRAATARVVRDAIPQAELERVDLWKWLPDIVNPLETGRRMRAG
jgi:hypothetical protein